VKTTVMALSLLVCCAITGLGIEVTLGILGGYGAFGNVNELVATFEEDNGLTLPDLHSVWGLKCDVPLWSPAENARVGVGLMGLSAMASSRDLVIESALFGFNGWADYQLGQFSAGIDIGACRGSLSFPEARLVGLAGWGLGMTGRVSYKGIALGPFTIGTTLSLHWLPIQEMQDDGGQKYRGRGTAFLDFSGIAVSIDLGWQSR